MKPFKKLLLLAAVIAAVLASLYRSDIPVDALKEKYAPEPSQFMELEGMNVHYRDEGQGEVLLLIHGTSASLHTWDVWTDELKDSLRIVRLDLPAFGLTGPSEDGDYSSIFYAEFINEFCKSLKIEKCHIAGNSLGGRIAWTTAQKYPNLVKSLILIDASRYMKPGEAPFIFKLARLPLISNLVAHLTPHALIRMNLKEVYGDESRLTDTTVERYYDLMRREGNRHAFIQRARLLDKTSVDMMPMDNITMPVLIMWGEKDRWIPLEDAWRFKEELPHARVITYPDAGHVPMEEIPERTAFDARAFLHETGAIR